MKTKINEAIKEVLMQFGEKYYIGEVLNKNKVIQNLDNYDETLIEAFINNEIIKKNFTINIAGNIVIQISKIIELFEADEYWQDSYTKYSKKIGLTANEKFIDESTDVVIDFPYKDTILKASMSKEDLDKDDLRPDEPFLNEIIAREEIDILLDNKILVNAKKYDYSGNYKIEEFLSDDNLVIKGNNLLALHTLKDKLMGQVKMIYIDPPYNTGNDSFHYNDKFNKSTWLTFMKNRLEVAKSLLSETGIIVIQCDDNELAYLKVLSDEIFGSHNFVSNISVKMSTLSGVKVSHKNTSVLKESEYLLIYSINRDKVKIKPQYKPSLSISEEFQYFLEKSNSNNPKDWKVRNLREVLDENNLEFDFKNKDTFDFIEKNSNKIWRRAFIRNKFKKISQDNPNEIIRNIDSSGKEHLYYRGREIFFLSQRYNETFTENNGYIMENSELIGNIWTDINISRLFNEGGVQLNNGKKPEFLIARILDMFTNEKDLILDFFMGSGTTPAVAHKMKRRYIGIEQMDYVEELAIQRLENVILGDSTGISKAVNWCGGGNFVYVKLMEKNRGFLKSIQKAESVIEIRNILSFMLEKAEIDFRVDLETVKDTLHELSLEDQKKVLIKIIDKNQLYYNFSEIDDENVRDLIEENDYNFNKNFYNNEED